MKKGKKKRLSRNERLSTYIGIIHRVSAITVSVPSRTTVPPPSLSPPTPLSHTPLTFLASASTQYYSCTSIVSERTHRGLR